MGENLVRVPTRFFIDHKERDLPTPEVVKETKNHYWIRFDDPNIDELGSDAFFYAFPHIDGAGPGQSYWGLTCSARATVKALAKAGMYFPQNGWGDWKFKV